MLKYSHNPYRFDILSILSGEERNSTFSSRSVGRMSTITGS